MADPNHGRDIEGDILRVLAEADGPMTAEAVTRALGSLIHFPTVCSHLSVMASDIRATAVRGPWVERHGLGLDSRSWLLTAEGRRVAEARGLTGRTESAADVASGLGFPKAPGAVREIDIITKRPMGPPETRSDEP